MEIENKIKEVLNTIRPFLISDGGDVEFIRYENGIVYVNLKGACSHCSIANETIEGTIYNALSFEVPEVIKVINVEDEI